jgi:hypothetical protein
MESTDSNDSDALNDLDEYAGSLEERLAILEARIANFKIAGPGISGDMNTGFTYSDLGLGGEQPEGPES